MNPRKKRQIIANGDINWNYFKIHNINKDGTILFRCKICRQCKLRKEKNQIIRIYGHKKNCIGAKSPILPKSNYLKSSFNTDNKVPNSSELTNKIDNEITKDKSYKSCQYDKSEENNIIDTTIILNESFGNNIIKKQKLFQLLINSFDKNNNLNKYQEKMGIYYVNRNKIIGEGSYSKVFLGEDEFQRMNVAVLQMDINDEDSFTTETFVLERIHGKGNFPQIYNSYMDENYFYIVENLMGPNLNILHKLCDKKFNYYTVVNIAIDLMKNIRIIHELGFIHRDLKPDNIVFGNLCFENSDKRNEIGIIDFSNAKINIKANGKFKYTNKKVKCQGNKSFSSTNALKDKDVQNKDDIISIFYVLLYFLKGELPWKSKDLKGIRLSKNEIIEIREKFTLKKLCENIPNDFENLVEYVFNMPSDINLDYDYIVENLEKIKKIEESKQNNNLEKFCWIELLEKYLERSKDIDQVKRDKIKAMLDKYCIKLKEYLLYIKSN